MTPVAQAWAVVAALVVLALVLRFVPGLWPGRLERPIALRYLRSRRGSRLASLIT